MSEKPLERGLRSALTVGGAAGGSVAGAVAHLDPLPAHLQQAGIWDASFARVAEALLIVAAVVRDVDRGPGGPGCGLLQVGTRQGVARLVLLQGEPPIYSAYFHGKHVYHVRVQEEISTNH